MASSALDYNDFDEVAHNRSAATASRVPSSPLVSFDKFKQAYGQGPTQQWQIEAVQKLLGFTRLKPGWDGYSAPPMKWDTGMFALQVLESIMRPRTPLPQIVPSSTGGVQFEWHMRGVDIELHIAGPFECELWFEDHNSGEDPVSEILTTDLSKAREVVSVLTSR
jgi:hypothetical protein